MVYPAGFGITWWSKRFTLSFSTYSPVYYGCHTPYYNSWYYGGYGYSSLYYGGWRSGWYGGLSYVCNPWPVYRTYYFHDPEPVIIERPVIVQNEIIIEKAQPIVITNSSTVESSSVSNTSPYPDDHIIVEERTTIRSSPEEIASAGIDPEYIYEDRFDPYYYDGDYLADELRIGFASYADTLNPESIWLSYAGLDLL